MKLYTEEQLHNTVKAIQNYLDHYDEKEAQENIEKHLKALKPIELPSDEEIEDKDKVQEFIEKTTDTLIDKYQKKKNIFSAFSPYEVMHIVEKAMRAMHSYANTDKKQHAKILENTYIKCIVEELINRHRSSFVELDIPTDYKKQILYELGISPNILDY